MPNETPTKSSGETVVEKGKPLPTDLAEQQDEKAATGEKVPESEKRQQKKSQPTQGTDGEHEDLPAGAFDEDEAANTDDVTAA